MTTLSPAEKMDRQYRFQRHIYDATRTHYLLWRARLIANLNPPANGTIVEIACGTGWNLIRAAHTYPTARLSGFDISSEMLITARTKIAAQGLAQRVTVAQGDATAFDLDKMFGGPAPDRIFISYALSMIPNWPAVIECALRALPAGGQLHIVDFGRMDRMPKPGKWALRRWLRHYNVSPRDDLETVAASIAARHGYRWTFEQTATGYANYGVLART